jgi:hypothetical protein
MKEDRDQSEDGMDAEIARSGNYSFQPASYF